MVGDYRMAAPHRVFRFKRPLEPCSVVSDRDRVDQILATLIDNALKYSPRDRPISVELRTNEAGVTVRVVDHGIGVPAAEREHIFSKHFRGSNVGHATHGLGMGLYFARKLSMRLYGSLRVESYLGRGSIFELALPWTWPEVCPRKRDTEGGAGGEARRA
jgi:signal transduction histidine kinase